MQQEAEDGSDYAYAVNGGYGGTLVGGEGYNGKYPNTGEINIPPKGGTQISGGIASILSIPGGEASSGTFGKGGNGNPQWGSAGGSGYYGGGGGGTTGYSVDSGAGGSSFISGYEGCNAISSTSTSTSITHTNNSVHYSGMKFENAIMKAGNEIMPTQEKNLTMSGNEGNGYVKITYLGN